MNDYPFAAYLEGLVSLMESGKFSYFDRIKYSDLEREGRKFNILLAQTPKENHKALCNAVVSYYCHVANYPLSLTDDFLSDAEEGYITEVCRHILRRLAKSMGRFGIALSEEHTNELVRLYGDAFIAETAIPRKTKGDRISEAKKDSTTKEFLSQYKLLRTYLEKLARMGFIAAVGKEIEQDQEIIKYKILPGHIQDELSYILRRLLKGRTPTVKKWNEVFSASTLFKDTYGTEPIEPDLEKVIEKITS